MVPAHQELLVVTGKGGVGKSTVAAALGRHLAERPPRDGDATLVLEIDPRESVHRLLGVAPSGGEIVPAGNGLYLQNLQPRQVIDRIVRERVRVAAVARRVLASPIYGQFVAGAPGLEPLAVLWHALRLLRGEIAEAPRIGRVLLDAPATGHGLSLLIAPRLVSDAIVGGPVGEATSEVAAWIAEPRRVGVVVVALAEEMPVSEALELRDELREKFGRDAAGLVVNGVYPEVPSDEAAKETRDELTRLWRRRRRLNELELERLERIWRRPCLELPLLAHEPGPDLVTGLMAELARLDSEPVA